ncbi:MAG: hypothetical protein LBR74_08295 [Eubacterium sp.]|nr:hypothetical protein [Eubacterium sp.]
MKSFLLMMQSNTEANKAKYHLNRLKINSVVEKITSQNQGCSYGVRIYDRPEKVCRLLSVVNIECTEIRSGNGEL